MQASHREIRKRIMDRMSKISDREFFTSRAYRGYLTDITESATKKYRRPIRVMLFDASEDPTVAYTDYSGIYREYADQGAEVHQFGGPEWA